MSGKERIGAQRHIDKKYVEKKRYVERRKNSRYSEDCVISGGRYD